MKRYKLKRELPTFKAGEIFYISDMGNLLRESDNVPVYSWSTLEKFPNILTDWFEEANESTRWKPEMCHGYYLLDDDGTVYNNLWDDDPVDNGRFNIGNCFQTKEEAEKVVEYLKALSVVRGDATTKFTKGKNNWSISYSTLSNRLIVATHLSAVDYGIFGLPYFATEEDARRSIESHKDEWLTIFGVKEEVCD